MSAKAICPICERRRGERYCPAKGEKICAIDCGTEREVSIDCPGDCSYLSAAHRWEHAHPKPLAENEIPFPDVSFPSDLIRAHQEELSGIGYAVATYARGNPELVDVDVFAAVIAMTETCRTLLSGIHYEKPPVYPIATGLYDALAKSIEEQKRHAEAHPEFPAMANSDLFHMLVFFTRFARLRSNGRPRTRGFIEFLLTQFPQQSDLAKEEARIVLP